VQHLPKRSFLVPFDDRIKNHVPSSLTVTRFS
jgi:hypothetical protein